MIGPKTRAKPVFKVSPRAIIVPHAGYIYSGFTANTAYTILANSAAKRVIVIGPSHHYYFKGISGSYFESYESPCGDIPIDTAYLIDLAKKFKIKFVPEAHQKEHSTEVQMPFVQHYLPRAEVVELIYGDFSSKSLAQIIRTLLRDPDNVVVISTDLSHYYDKEKAYTLDRNCMKGIASLNVKKLEQGCEACGITGIKGVIRAAKSLGLRSELVDYRTSADYSGDDSKVVGYTSAVIY